MRQASRIAKDCAWNVLAAPRYRGQVRAKPAHRERQRRQRVSAGFSGVLLYLGKGCLPSGRVAPASTSSHSGGMPVSPLQVLDSALFQLLIERAPVSTADKSQFS